jgi:hypothetical protein
MLFDNRPPINLDNAEKLAEVGRDGGAYNVNAAAIAKAGGST